MTGYVGPIEKITEKNKYFRQVLFTGKHLQLPSILLTNSAVERDRHASR